MVDNIASERKQAAQDIGLSETEYAFYNILMAEVVKVSSGGVVEEAVFEEVKATSQVLVERINEATMIVDFFNKPDEIKRMKKEIKRDVLMRSFGDKALVSILQERFMELAKTKFGK